MIWKHLHYKLLNDKLLKHNNFSRLFARKIIPKSLCLILSVVDILIRDKKPVTHCVQRRPALKKIIDLSIEYLLVMNPSAISKIQQKKVNVGNVAKNDMIWFGDQISNIVYIVGYKHCAKKWIFQIRISSVMVTKSAVSRGFGHINWRNPWWKT